MSKEKFTKGPWEIAPVLNGIMIGGHPHKMYPIGTTWDDKDGDAIGVAICILPNEDITPTTLEYVAANARLISHAPELYELLRSGLEDGPQSNYWSRVEELLNKINNG